jgi:hypothetical protein
VNLPVKPNIANMLRSIADIACPVFIHERFMEVRSAISDERFWLFLRNKESGYFEK